MVSFHPFLLILLFLYCKFLLLNIGNYFIRSRMSLGIRAISRLTERETRESSPARKVTAKSVNFRNENETSIFSETLQRLAHSLSLSMH